MALNCKNCNNKIEEKFKFCPHCGFELIENYRENDAAKDAESFSCEVCGEINSPDNQFCSGCGAKLPGDIIPEKLTQKSKKVTTQKKQRKPALKTEKVNQNTDSFSPGKLISIFSGVLVIGLVVLYSSGVFDSSVKKSDALMSNNLSSGVDLNNLQRINQLRESVKTNPDDLEMVLELGHLLMDSGFFTEAISIYQKYLTKDPKNADVIVDMGVCYFELNQLEIADSVMQSALVFNPQHQIGHLNLGVVNLKRGNTEKSKEWFRKAIEINPATEYAQRAKQLLESH
ncbi:MAG: tetratricopeptide repeat protein [Bacteroidetes bacterium]|nr:tetratricopeptide repeat protein [Bacteroidota bacterium]